MFCQGDGICVEASQILNKKMTEIADADFCCAIPVKRRFRMEREMEQFAMKEKLIPRLVFMMSMPSVLSMLVNSLYNIVDSFFVAQISENAMGALSLVFPMQNLMTSIAVGFGVGVNAMIALNLGAKNQKAADAATSFGVVFSFLHGILFSVFGIFIMPWFLNLFTTDWNLISLGLEYSNIAFLFAISVNVGIGMEKIFQSVGRMKTSMLVLMVGCVTNIVLDPILIFGLGPIPAMGITGAALATGIGQSITVILYVLIWFKKPLPVKVSFQLPKGENILGKLYYIGVPATLNMALPSLLISVLNGILSVYSPIYVVILGIYYKLQTFVYLPANGIIQGIRPLISFNYGAKEYAAVKKIYHTALGFSAVIMLTGTAICMLLPENLMRLFTAKEETIVQGTLALRLISIGFVVSAVSITTCGALEALGKGISSLVISILRYVVFMIPLAFLLSSWLGACGVWHAFWVTEFLACAVSFTLYQKIFVSGFKKGKMGKSL